METKYTGLVQRRGGHLPAGRPEKAAELLGALVSFLVNWRESHVPGPVV